MRPSVPHLSKLVLGFILLPLASGPVGARAAASRARSCRPATRAPGTTSSAAPGPGQPRADVDEASWTFQELDVNNEAQVYTTKQCRRAPTTGTPASRTGGSRCGRAARSDRLRGAATPMCAPHFGQRSHAKARYSSARLMTKHKVHFPDGYIEFRVRLPEAERAGPPESGLWPAVWMLGENITEGPPPGDVKWPACGEVDIMEWPSAGGVSKQGWNAIWLGPGGTTRAATGRRAGTPRAGPARPRAASASAPSPSARATR